MYLDTVKNDVDYNRKIFLNYISSIKKIDNLYLRCILAKKAANFAVTHSTGIYSSDVIEKCFIDLANIIHVNLSKEYKEKSILHVMTEAYSFGGHTRCVERWVNLIDDRYQDCVLLSQNYETPRSLLDAFDKVNGSVFIFNEQNYIDKAIKLRQLASSYELVILHIHMDDPTALIAFGTTNFKRPILFFNHADHIFWLGASIADCVANLNTIGEKVCKEKRNNHTSYMLGIPVDQMNFKKALKLNVGCKIFISGSCTKFRPVDEINFYRIISDILMRSKEVKFVIIGANIEDAQWKKVRKQFSNSVDFYETKSYKEYLSILSSCTLVIDSYPIGGGTALLDAVSCGIPVLSLNKDFQMDYIVKSKASFNNYNDFIKTIIECLNSNEKRKEIYHNLAENFKVTSSIEIWKKNYYTIEKNILLKEHLVSIFSKQNNSNTEDLLALKIANWVDNSRRLKKLKQKCKYIFSISIKKGYITIFIFNKPYVFITNKTKLNKIKF